MFTFDVMVCTIMQIAALTLPPDLYFWYHAVISFSVLLFFLLLVVFLFPFSFSVFVYFLLYMFLL